MAKKKKDARMFLWFECKECGSRNYRFSKNTKNTTKKLELKKFCPVDRKHTPHVERKK